MALAPGTRLGPYEILGPLGAGGMGEVYRARDTRLDRAVALKVLPSHVSDKPEARQRFEREARLISSLNHPHICTLHDVGHQDGVDFIVMELLEGETLADRLERGPLPTDHVLRYAIEIADALDKAHRHGIVHRDLKPGNVMLTKSGAKLLDFGLAKLKGSEGKLEGSALSERPTEAKPLTGEGTILGTFQYMAPEQLEGKEADARTDIFTLGSVLHEMATGKRAFEGKSRASLIASILSSEPPSITALQPMRPPALDHLVRTCLAKEPDDRWQNAHDLMRELRWIAEGGSQAGTPAVVVTHHRSRERLASAVAAVAILMAAAFGIGYVRRAPNPLRLLRATIELPAGLQVDALNASLALSPGGRFLALAGAGADGKQQLYLRALDSTAMQPLSGTEGATYPFWSPDAKSLAFFANGKLKRIEVAGGAVQTICDAPDGRGGTWGPDGTIVFAAAVHGPLSRVVASGGAPSDAEQAVGAGESHRLPHFLPDGKRVLFLKSSGVEIEGIYALDLTTRKVQLVVHERSEGRYVPPGYLAFVRERNLMVQPFDPERLRVSGEAVPVAESQQFSRFRATTEYSFEGTDLLLYQMDPPAQQRQLTWFSLDGKKLSTVGDPDPATIIDLSLSPEGKRAIAQIEGPDGLQLWTIDLARGVRSRFTVGIKAAVGAQWSPDGKHVAFGASASDNSWSVQLKDADGGSPGNAIFSSQDSVAPTDWSPDGQELAFATQSSATKSADIGILSMNGDHMPRLLLATHANEQGGTFSPDGRWLAYASDESGRREIYAIPYPGPGGRWQISAGGAAGGFAGRVPIFWNGNSQILYFSADKRVFVVDVTARGGSLEVGASRRVFGDTAIPLGAAADYSSALKQFLVAVPIGEQKAAPIALVTNWAAEMKKQ